MAAIPFIDTHFHLHDMMHPTLRYAWLERRRARPVTPKSRRGRVASSAVAAERQRGGGAAAHFELKRTIPEP